jgi:hypothetical protein
MLIKLVSIHPAPSPQSIPLANAFLKAYAINNPVSIELVDFFLGDSSFVCSEKLSENELPEAIGFSMYVWNRELILAIAAELRLKHPDIRLFCGGPEVTAAPGSVLASNVFDFIVSGEGEAPFSALCKALANGEVLTGISGLIFSGTESHSTPVPITDIDSIPSPYLTGIIDTSIYSGVLWQLSRGCSFTCDFCFDSRGIHGVRRFSLNRIEEELKHFSKTGVSQVFVLDSTFNFDQKRAKAILKMIKKHAPEIHFHFEVRSEFIDREMAQLFAKIACSLQIGLQSADKEVLKLVGRSFNKADFSSKIGLLNESGATFGFDLIYGLPGDTLANFRRSLDYALSLYPNHLDIFPLAVLPGTELHSNGPSLKLLWNAQPPYVLESSETFCASDLDAATDLAVACDVFYTRGKAVAWFNSVITTLAIKPSEFLLEFSDWLITQVGKKSKESDFTDDIIYDFQQRFLGRMFGGKNTKRFLPIVLDLIQYHYNYAALLISPYQDVKPQSSSFTNTSFLLAPTARIVQFKYDINELLDCGEPNLLWMYQHLSPSGSHAVMYRHNGLVCSEALDTQYMILLVKIRDGKFTADSSEAGLTKEEMREFLEFAVSEGIIVKL